MMFDTRGKDLCAHTNPLVQDFSLHLSCSESVLCLGALAMKGSSERTRGNTRSTSQEGKGLHMLT